MLEMALEEARQRARGLEQLSDGELLRAAAGGDREAFGHLIRRHQKRVLTLAYRVTERWDAAQSIACDAFLRLRSVGRGALDTPVHILLAGIVVELCGQTGRASADDEQSSGSAVVDALHPLLQRQTSTKVRHHIRLLSDSDRLALILHRYEGLNQAQIAHAMEVRPGDVEAALARAYAHMGAGLTGTQVSAGRLSLRGCLSESQLVRLLSGELSAESGSLVHAHLACCERCRSRHAALEETWRQLDSWVVSPPAEDLSPRILPAMARGGSTHWRTLARVAAVVLVVATAGSGPSQPAKARATPAAHTMAPPATAPAGQ